MLLLPQEECDPLVVLHELNHLRRRDLEYKGLMMAACWLHWFNPLVWWMSRVAGRNLELCCDEDVAGKENSAFHHRYGRLLLECATEGAGPVLSSRFGSSKEELKARLTNLFVAKKRGRALVCLALACAVLAGGLVACEQTPCTRCTAGRVGGEYFLSRWSPLLYIAGGRRGVEYTNLRAGRHLRPGWN